MRPVVRWIVSQAYAAVSRPPLPEQLVEVAPGTVFPGYIAHYAGAGPREAERFFGRMPAWLDVREKTVLDIGCGLGSLCLEAARRGARRVVGVDSGRPGIEYARWRLSQEPEPPPVEYRLYGGDPGELGDERFDVVLSKDSFERYKLRPPVDGVDAMAHRMADRLHDGGLLAVRLGPPWKAPYGGHIDAWLPWAHLLFPEDVIFERYRATRPGKSARTFDEGVGVNQLTLARFRRAMEATGLECLHLAANVGERRAMRALRALGRLPGAEEYLTQNVYGVWRRPTGRRPPRPSAASRGEAPPTPASRRPSTASA